MAVSAVAVRLMALRLRLSGGGRRQHIVHIKHAVRRVRIQHTEHARELLHIKRQNLHSELTVLPLIRLALCHITPHDKA